MTRQFRENLTDAADEAQFVDLSSRVRAASRRQTVKRTIVACTVLAMALIAGVAGLSRFQFHTVSQPADFGSIGGDFMWVATDSEDTVQVLRQHGETVTPVLTLPGDEVLGEVSISPDGVWAAWETDDADGIRDITVANLASEDRIKAASYDATQNRTCLSPTWAPDGPPRLLTVAPEQNNAVQWFNVETQKADPPMSITKEKSGDMCELHPGGGGEGYNLYYATTNGFEIRYMAADGTFHNTGAIGRLEEPEAGADWDRLTGVSADGKAACVGTNQAEAEDPVSRRDCEAIIDVHNGSILRDFQGATAVQVLFTSNNGLVTRDEDGVIQRIETDGKIVAQLTEKTQFADDELVAYIPG